MAQQLTPKLCGEKEVKLRGGFAPSPKSPPPQARNTSPYGGGLKKSQREAKPLLKNLFPLSL